jgi:Putative auto-transporter adhesin, head GIN domain
MKRIFAITACTLALPVVALAASRTYDTGAFERVSVAAGVEADITIGPTRSVIAEASSDDFNDLRISVQDNVLHIDRPASSWFSNWFSHRPDYQVHVVTPALRSLSGSSGAQVTVKGALEGDFSVNTSSGSHARVAQVKGGTVKASTSSGSGISIAGSCVSLEAGASSGSGLDAEDLKCESVTLQASSGSDMSVAASKSVTGEASSGSGIRVRGKPGAVQVDTSSGAHLVVKE